VKIFGRSCLLLASLLTPVIVCAQTGREAILPEGTKLSLQLNDNLSTKKNNDGDTFTATVTDPVYLKDRVVIPKGSIVCGSVTRVLRPGRFKGKAQMNLLFSSIRLQDSAKTLPIVASLARLDPETNASAQGENTITPGSSAGKDAARIGSPAVTGAVIGAIVGHGHGAAIGAGVGAAVGLASVLAVHGADVEVKRGAAMDIVLDRPLTVPLEIVKREPDR
jgi:outer membrane usher protein FimD/PapC